MSSKLADSEISPNEAAELTQEVSFGELKKNLLSCFDASRTSSEISFCDTNGDFMNVYLRIRPYTNEEIKHNEDQNCFQKEDDNSITVVSNTVAPLVQKASLSDAKSHKFTFTRIFDANTSQTTIFRSTILKPISTFLDGQSWLIFTYGVTNSGKTFTIQGTAINPGILPRAIDVVFNSIEDYKFPKILLKPVNYCDVKMLNKKEIKEEFQRKDIIFGNLNEKDSDVTTSSCDSSNASKLTASLFSEDSKENMSVLKDALDRTAFDFLNRMKDKTVIPNSFPEGTQFSVWISFYEIYNEYIYDLLEPLTSVKVKRRPSLKLAEDKGGNIYIKGLKEVCIFSAEEALKLLLIGQRNLRYADTKLNHNSSRSHCIYTIKIIHIPDVDDLSIHHISRLSFCDLAGSERSSKTLNAGERMKETGNINTSLLSLGRCIDAIRYNQTNRDKKIVPFRDSKLCRVFQSYLSGRGKVSMIVNINQCASMIQETLHSLHFSAIATQVSVISREPPKPTKLSLMLQNIERRKTLSWCPEPEQRSSVYSTLSVIDDESEEEDDDDECHCRHHNCESHLTLIKSLEEQLKKEQREKLNLESEIRAEVVEEMSKFLPSIDSYGEEISRMERQAYDYAERRIALYSDYLKKSRRETMLSSSMDEQDLDGDDDNENITICEVNGKEGALEWKEEKQLLEDEINSLKETIKKLSEKNKSYRRSSMLFISKENSQVISGSEEFKQQLNEAKSIIQKQESEIKELNLTLDEAGATFLSTEKEIEKYKTTIENQEEMISRLNRTVEKLEGELGDRQFLLEDREVKISDLEEEVKSLHIQLEKSQSEVQEKDEKITKLEEEIKKLKDEKSNKANIQQELEEVKFEALAQTSQMTLDICKNEKIMKEQDQTIKKLTEKIGEVQKDFQILSDKLKSKDSELELANEKVLNLTSQLNDREMIITALQSANEESQNKLQEENTRLNQQIEELQISVNELKGNVKEMKILKETLEAKDSEIKSLHSEIEEIETELKNSRCNTEIAYQKNEEIKSISEKSQELERNLEVAEFNLQCSLYAARELLELDSVETLPEGMEIINVLKNHWSAKLKLIVDNEEKLTNMEKTVNRLKENELRLEADLSSMAEKLNQQKADTSLVIRKDESECEEMDKMKSELKIKTKEIEQLKKFVDDQDVIMSQQDSLIKERERKLSSLEKGWQEMQDEIKQLKEIIEENNSELKLSEKEVIELKDEIRRLNTENSALIQEAIKDEKDMMLKREQELEEKVKSQKKELRIKEKELEKFKSNMSEDRKNLEKHSMIPVVQLTEADKMAAETFAVNPKKHKLVPVVQISEKDRTSAEHFIIKSKEPEFDKDGTKPKRSRTRKTVILEDNYDSHEDFEKENTKVYRTRKSARRKEKQSQGESEELNISRRTRRAAQEAKGTKSNLPVRSSKRRPLYKPETSEPLVLSPDEISSIEDQSKTSAYSMALSKLRERREAKDKYSS